MADPNNSGQFGNRADTSEAASRGGQASHSGSSSSTQNRLSKAGKKGAEAQSREAKAKGGHASHRNR